MFYHIVRETNRTGGFDPNEISNSIVLLNQVYNPHNISLNNAGFDYIDDSYFYNIDDMYPSTTEFDSLIQINNHPDAINVYIVNNFNYNGKAEAIRSQALVIKRSKVLTPVLAHEIGHCLDLYHTYQGTWPGTLGCAETIIPTEYNCTHCGDLVCDTPADYGVEQQGYMPDLYNIMSNYERIHFTLGQAMRMRRAFASSSMLQQLVSDVCPNVVGASLICDTETYTLINVDLNSSINWILSSGLQFASPPMGTTVSVKPDPNRSEESGWVRAVVDQVPHTRLVDFPINTTSYTLNGQDGNVSIYHSLIHYNVAPVEQGVSYYWFITTNYKNCGNSSPSIPDPQPPKFYPQGTTTLTTQVPYVDVDWGECPGSYVLNCIVQNPCNIGAGFKNVHVFNSDIDPCPGNDLNVFPNPVSNNSFTINIIDDPCDDFPQPPGITTSQQNYQSVTVKIFDLQGSIQFTGLFNSYNIQVDGLSLPPGLYLIKIFIPNEPILQTSLIIE